LRFVGTTRKGIFFRKASSSNTQSDDGAVVDVHIAIGPCDWIDHRVSAKARPCFRSIPGSPTGIWPKSLALFVHHRCHEGRPRRRSAALPPRATQGTTKAGSSWLARARWRRNNNRLLIHGGRMRPPLHVLSHQIFWDKVSHAQSRRTHWPKSRPRIMNYLPLKQ
jgi:hypothetical protein